MNTHSKKFFEAIWPFQTFYEVQILKIFMNALFEKFFEYVRLVSKIFLSVDFENIHEYTFEKNSLKLFSPFGHSLRCQF